MITDLAKSYKMQQYTIDNGSIRGTGYSFLSRGRSVCAVNYDDGSWLVLAKNVGPALYHGYDAYEAAQAVSRYLKQ